MAEAFFSRLPPNKLTNLETELRDTLTKAAAVAEKFLPRAGTVTLQEWVDRRVHGQVSFITSEEGLVAITAGNGAVEASAPPRAAGQPVKPVAKAAAATSPAALEAFFSRLPVDSFTQQEEGLRAALHTMLDQRGSVPCAEAVKNPAVNAAAKATLVRAVTLADWVQRRIGAEIQVVEENGAKILQLAGGAASKEERKEAFFSGLPDGRFSPEEIALRGALVDFLATWKSKELATLSNAGSDKRVQAAKVALLGGREGPCSLRDWVQRRVGGELTLSQDAKGQYVINVTPSSRHLVAARFQELSRSGQLDAGPAQAKGGQKGKAQAALPDAQGKGGAKKGEAGAKKGEAGADKGKGSTKGAGTAASNEVARKAFFGGLPDDSLEQGEIDLRQALFEFLGGWDPKPEQQHPPVRLVEEDKEVQRCKAALLPQGVTLKDWIETRVGGELACKRLGGQGLCLMLRDEVAEEDAAEKEALAAKKEAFWAALPTDGFSPEEETLREALLTFIDSSTGNKNERATLSTAGSNAQVREAKLAVVPKGCPVTFKEWIEKRVAQEIRVFEFPDKQIGIGRNKGDKIEQIREAKEGFFERLPEDGFTPEEEQMRDALIQFISNFQSPDGAPPSLSAAGSDAQVREARAALLPKSGVSLRDWIDRRIGGEVETLMPDEGPGKPIYVGLRGVDDLEAKLASATTGTGKKRKAPPDAQAQAKGGAGKGGGKAPAKGGGKGGAAPAGQGAAKRQRR